MALKDMCVCGYGIACVIHPIIIEPQGNVVPIARGAWLKAQKGKDAEMV
jgi:hypothetical protein